jgi:hypothetical protein
MIQWRSNRKLFWSGLRKEDFQLFDGKHRQEITSFRVQQASALSAHTRR